MIKNILLQCVNIDKFYKNRNKKILSNINFELNYGESVSLLGKSGAGKSTLLHIIIGLEKPSKGYIKFNNCIINQLNDEEISKIRNEKIGFVYQFHHLLADFTVLENISMPMIIKGVNIKLAYQAAYKIMKKLGLQDHGKYYPKNLSGGERQRVAIARAFINKPLIILADEPTGNLDKYNSKLVLNLIKNSKKKGIAFLIATHDLNLSNNLDRKLELCDGYIK